MSPEAAFGGAVTVTYAGYLFTLTGVPHHQNECQRKCWNKLYEDGLKSLLVDLCGKASSV